MQELSNLSDSTDSSQGVGNAVCECCRRRKLKCDRKRPSCMRCQSRNITCRYTLPPKRRLRILAKNHQVQNRPLTELPSLCPKNSAFRYSPEKTYPMSSPSITDISGHDNETSSHRESSAGLSSSRQSTPTLSRVSPAPSTGLLSSSLRPQDLYQIDRWVEESRRQFHRMSLSPPPCGQGAVNSEHSDSDSVASAACSATTVVSCPTIVESSDNRPDLYWQDPFAYLIHRLVQCGTRIDSLSSLEVTGRLSSMTIPPSLFSITDILFHNDILLYFMYMFSRFICPENPTAYYNRLVFRYRKGWISKPLRLVLAVMLAPLSVHPALSPEEWLYGSLIYRRHVEVYIQDCLEDHDNVDSYMVPWVLSQYVLSIGEVTKSQLLIGTVVRKLQQWRCHLIDLPKPPPDRHPPLQDKVLDLTQVKSPLYKNTMRIVWWETLHNDIILSLLLAQPPNIDLSTVCVNYPTDDEETRLGIIEAIQDPSSQVHSDPRFPSILYSFPECRGLTFAMYKFRELAYEIAVLRAQQWPNLEEWLGKITKIGQQLQAWSTELERVKLGLENTPTETLPTIHKYQHSQILQTQIFHTMLLFFLYHSQGPVLNNTVTCSGPESPTERGDYFSPLFYQKCWEAVVTLQALTSQNGTLSIYYENTTCASTLAIAGIVCIETMERSQDPKVVQFAETFLDDSLAFLNRAGRLWTFNANMANKLSSWSESPRPWIPIVRLIT
ncbi:hypothetical protein IWQ62_001500 [Dispira parvispora]|uniref:Zn(2)-C6 fungal-type domain-containing protein n=1 Tax=Dispira parvispora TaxID=1520584 RepID=A0A9W8AUV9_9FUNG|nr:hypothetical protein IWQ62_001500 [Dispira parvispora]